MSQSIRLPELPEASEKPGLPLLASAAPIVGSLAMWAITRSPYALLFALLGPLVAIGGLLDSRRRQRKSTRAARARFEADRTEVSRRIEAEHHRERRELEREAVAALDILTRQHPSHERWSHDPSTPLKVSLGTGTVPSALRVEGGERDELARHAARLNHAQVLVDARDGIAIVGTGATPHGVFRALILQLAHALSPEHTALHIEFGSESMPWHERDWLTALPHAVASDERRSEKSTSSTPITVRFERREGASLTGRAGEALATLALVHGEGELPRECRVAVQPQGVGLRVLRWPHPDSEPADVRPHLLTSASTRRLAAELRSAAVADGLLADSTVPSSVSVGELGDPPSHPSSSLACAFGLGPGALPLVIDLLADGPHALVAGTTGSGKSELLCAWILALAITRSPRELAVLLVDFKGGASFRTIESLPHVVGCITDLDPAEATRAIESLSAEVRHRERRLASNGARDISDLPRDAMPRLVIVVDEYAALVSEHPGLQSVFADIAARGRSLGLHLVLSTQRPAGIVRDSILANTPLRVSLRVLDPADSTATIGGPGAAQLAGDPPGRALITSPNRPVTPVQPALVTAQDVSAARTLHGDPESFSPRRPWLPPLPLLVTRDDLLEAEAAATSELRDPGIPFALIDRPATQSRAVARLDLSVTSNLLVVGARGSGRSSALAALAESAEASGINARVLPGDVEGAWDAVHDALAQLRRNDSEPVLLVADDLDLTLSRTPEEHRDTLARALASLLVEGPARGVALVLSVARVGAAVASLATHCNARLVLRTADPNEHHAAGADPRRFSPDLPPGRGWYRGELVHLVAPTGAPLETGGGARAETPVLPRETRAIVTPRPAALVETLTAAWGRGSTMRATATELSAPAPSTLSVTDGETPRVLVADPDTWLTRAALLTELSRTGAIAYHDCGLSAYRQLSGNRVLPPPLANPADTVWLAHPSTGTSRARLPSG